MKKTYLIQYNIAEEDNFNLRIKSLGNWTKYFNDNWLVESELSAKEIYEKLSKDFEDKSIFVLEVNITNYWGRMNTKLWDFLKTQKKRID